jgi:hypothetical protein
MKIVHQPLGGRRDDLTAADALRDTPISDGQIIAVVSQSPEELFGATLIFSDLMCGGEGRSMLLEKLKTAQFAPDRLFVLDLNFSSPQASQSDDRTRDSIPI